MNCDHLSDVACEAGPSSRQGLRPLAPALAALLAAGWLAALPGPVMAESMRVDTPQGVFECENSMETDNRQVLRLNGQELYHQPRGPGDPEETDLLKDGIIDRNLGCPSVAGQRGGYVVLERYLQPPQYGVIGYLLADFDQDEPTLTDLGASDGAVPSSDAPKKQGLYLNDGGLVLRYTGILPDALAPENQPDDPPPADHAILYSFSLGTLQNLDTCLPLKGVPLFGDMDFLAKAADPARYLPADFKIGASRTETVAALRRYGTPYDPDDTDGGSVKTAPQLVIPLCGDANGAVMPLFQFDKDRLKAVRFEELEF
ncbi:MAG: hypothetical protein WBF84_14420 [Castellaniella sp.]|uniref:hypothetical protein n=1 Tax=Castellaniella sp. TaxID=1955812 RepID=UPI003C721F3E